VKIPIFLSCPTDLSTEQIQARNALTSELERLGLETHTLDRSDYPAENPLKEVLVIARRCSGGIILGFEQFQCVGGIWKRGTAGERTEASTVIFPTAWNHLEAGLLFSLDLPLLVFKEKGISGGVFDSGVTDVFIYTMPKPPLNLENERSLAEAFLKWQAKVREHYSVSKAT
jgi:hypothetical protein